MSGSEPGEGASRPRILVGVDGSKDGLRAVRYPIRRARASGADLRVVHVVDDKAVVSGLWDLLSTVDELHEAGQVKVDEALAVLAAEGFESDRVTSEVLLGRPGEVLAELSNNAQLLVLGRRSISGLERMFVGSTSVSAAARAGCPVIVISAASTPHETGGLRMVAVAVNTWPVHASALEWGVREATLRKARLRVVHVVPETLGVEGAAFVAAATADLENQLSALRQDHPEADLDVEVLLGDPIDQLVATSRVADLLILGLHPEGPALGGLVRGVMAHSHCPVGLCR
jgi:nucleotide-binding universal stress UspA family protein